MTIDSDRDLEGMRRAARVVGEALAAARDAARPGITTAMLDDVVAEVFARHGARSAPKLLYGFPGDACICLNDETVHGVPGRTPIRAGDLVTIDVTAELDGYIADAAITLPMPKASGVKRRLTEAASAALDEALRAATAGATLREVGRATEAETRRHGFTVLREVGGHGVGRAIHEKPSVPNWDDPSARGLLHEGLVIAVEPIIAAGGRTLVEDRDGWTLRTSDGSPSAHAEHTIVVTNGEPLVLTAAA
jgi:methionyl aminopeptidase